jgi:hypothetical protein
MRSWNIFSGVPICLALLCGAVASQSVHAQCVPPPSGMVAWWPGDNHANDLINGNNGTLMAGAGYTAGEVLQAFNFGISGSHVNVPHNITLNFGTGNFSFDAWVKLPSGLQTRTILDKRIITGGTWGYDVYIYQGLPGIQIGDGSSTNYNANPADHASIADNSWHHVAVTVTRASASGILFYIDGVQLATPRDPTLHPGSPDNVANLRLGLSVDPANPLPLLGVADEIGLYSRALTATEILNNYLAGASGMCKSGINVGKNHFETWRVAPTSFFEMVTVRDQFMVDSLHLTMIEFLSNPARKIAGLDTFNITKPNSHLTWYRAMGRDTLLSLSYVNQFESTEVAIGPVEYLLLPTRKMPHAPPESLDHYKAYRITNPVGIRPMVILQDQFDVQYGYPQEVDSLVPAFFLTPAIKNMEQMMLFDSVTHYVAYEIVPKRFFPQPRTTYDQFGGHTLQIQNSEYLLVPSRKILQPPPLGSICGSKFNDLNCNSQWDPGEPGLAGWTINLAGPVNTSVITGAGGSYCFNNLPAGNYTVSEVLQAGWTQSMPPAPGSYNIMLPAGANVNGMDFGNCAQVTPPDTGRDHYNSWHVLPQQFFGIVRVRDQFMRDSLVLTAIEFLSNPAMKIHMGDTSHIRKPNDHLTWYRAAGRDTSITLEYVNQFESREVTVGAPEYLLVPAQKLPHAPPESLDHYKAYRITDGVMIYGGAQVQDQFDVGFGIPEYVDSLKPTFFLTPAIKNNEQQMLFDSVTHYVAYEIFPKRFFSTPYPVGTVDQFGSHSLEAMNSQYLLVPSRKILLPPQLGSICGSKFNDLNCNGQWDGGEPGLAGWTINLAGPVNTSVLTGAGGTYCFNGLPAGNYTVSENQQPGWTQTKPLPPGTYNIILLAGQNMLAIDFGNCIQVTPPDTGKNHYKSWRVDTTSFNAVVHARDQFMQDNLHLLWREFLSNPVMKIHGVDTFRIKDPDHHLTWYRAVGRDTSLIVDYVNQFEAGSAVIDAVQYLLFPTKKQQHAMPESLDHYKAYRIANPRWLSTLTMLEDQFDVLLGQSEVIDSIRAVYFLTPTVTDTPSVMFDSVTHYVAYEITPRRYLATPMVVNTVDRFGQHDLVVRNSELLLVPTRKLSSGPSGCMPGLDTLQSLGLTLCDTVRSATLGPDGSLAPVLGPPNTGVAGVIEVFTGSNTSLTVTFALPAQLVGSSGVIPATYHASSAGWDTSFPPVALNSLDPRLVNSFSVDSCDTIYLYLGVSLTIPITVAPGAYVSSAIVTVSPIGSDTLPMSATILSCQVPHDCPSWTDRFNGKKEGMGFKIPTPAKLMTRNLAVLPNGDIYMCGYSNGFGTKFDYVTRKYDLNGTLLWSRRYNKGKDDKAYALAVDDSGNVYVTGESDGGATKMDVLTVKYNASGDSLWTARYTSTIRGRDAGYAIALNDAGTTVYVTGETFATPKCDLVTMAYNAATGAQLGVDVYNGPGQSIDKGYAIDVDPSGFPVVTGESHGGATKPDYVTIKYPVGLTGGRLWVNRYDGGLKKDYGFAIKTDALGNVFVTGASEGPNTRFDYATLAYTPAGGALWSTPVRFDKTYKNDYGYDLVLDAAGNVYVTGASDSAKLDYSTVKYNGLTGALMWATENRFDSGIRKVDIARSVAWCDAEGKIFVTGSSDQGAGRKLDYVTLKIDAATGATNWVGRYNGPGVKTDIAYAVATRQGDCCVVLTGTSEGAGTKLDFATMQGPSAAAVPGPVTSPPIYDGEDEEEREEVVMQYRLFQCYPNPFNPVTTIAFAVPEDALVTVTVYDVLGRVVAVVMDGEVVNEGEAEVEFNAGDLASGVYFYRLTARGLEGGGSVFSGVKKMMLVK